MHRTHAFGVGAAAVVGGLLAGCGAVSPATPGAPSLTAASPAPEPSIVVGSLPEGPFRMRAGTDDRVPITVSIPATGWFGETEDGVLVKDDSGDPPDGAGLLAFNEGEYFVYADPCRWSGTRPAKPVATVDEVVTALASQASRDASAPADITVGGHPGIRLLLRVPDDAAFDACDDGVFVTFGVARDELARYAQGPGQIEEIWTVDVNGRVVLLVPMYFPQTTQTVVDQLHGMVASASFE